MADLRDTQMVLGMVELLENGSVEKMAAMMAICMVELRAYLLV